MRTVREEIKEKILGRMSRDSLMDKHCTLLDEYAMLQEKYTKADTSFRAKLEKKNEILSITTAQCESYKENVVGLNKKVHELNEIIRFRKAEYTRLDGEYKFLATMVREIYGSYALRDIFADERNPRKFSEEDLKGIVEGKQSQKYKIKNPFKIIYKHLRNCFLEIRAIIF